ncbi:MAG: Tol-Pal system beta propeller repeat protein TolB [Steroidobacteraceae bacterium]|jgi:TolB protein|nr:Tol-Pal system beta propeller repeat protein TolB [Steroidobacteraceae bacterium]
MTKLKLLLPALSATALALLSPAVPAQLRIDITSGVTDPIPVAVARFAQEPAAPTAAFDFAEVIRQDLERSGRFRLLPRERMPGAPSRADAVVAADWRNLGTDYVLVGRATAGPAAGQSTVDFELLNVLNGQRLLSERLVVPAATARNGAHRIADRVHEKILGVRGAFATRIAYVSVDGAPPNQRYQLLVADADGEAARVILESRQPLMSPAWSPDGEWLAYVSFEARASAVYVQRLRTGERRRVSARRGINGAPSWSPDGSKLALTLSGSGGNLDVYVLELATQALTRITDDPGIDTEPVWAPDGAAIYFTSDRSGGPQVYRVAPTPGDRPKRITFGGGYNARPRLSPDGTQLAFVTLEGGGYKVAIQDLAGGGSRVLTQGRFDESPSFAPNGATLIYAGRERGQGTLATVSADGLITQRLKSDRGEVREPAWGPFLR